MKVKVRVLPGHEYRTYFKAGDVLEMIDKGDKFYYIENPESKWFKWRFEEVKENIYTSTNSTSNTSISTTVGTIDSTITCTGACTEEQKPLCSKCKGPGEYWGLRLAFPQLLCFACLKIEHLKEPLPLTRWMRVKALFKRILFWSRK